MDATLKPSRLEGTLTIVSSKSLSHRALIAAACADGVSTVENMLASDDIAATKRALTLLGASIEGSTVRGGLHAINNITIDANESGSTLRLLIPLALTTNTQVTFTGKGRLPNRPITPYIDAFKHVKTFETPKDKALPLVCEGPLKAGKYFLPGNVSSQFVSGLLFALPRLSGDSTIELTSPLESKSYVDLTIHVLKHFGITIEADDSQYIIKGNQQYIPASFHVEGDYSQAAFFIVAAFLNGSLTLKGLHNNSIQGDRAILDIIQKMGAYVTHDENTHTIFAQAKKRQCATIDLSDIPDLGPILMIAAAASEGKTIIKNVQRLRYKESDRLTVMCDIVKRLGASIQCSDNHLTIHGVQTFNGNQTFDSHGDHRIVMALAIAALHANQAITIKNISCVKKSYPNFFEDYRHLGGDVSFHNEGNEIS